MKRVTFKQSRDFVYTKYKWYFLAGLFILSLLYGILLGPVLLLAVYFSMAVNNVLFSLQCKCGKLVNFYKDNFCSNCGKEVPDELKPKHRRNEGPL